jgi:hypothetical protein
MQLQVPSFVQIVQMQHLKVQKNVACAMLGSLLILVTITNASCALQVPIPQQKTKISAHSALMDTLDGRSHLTSAASVARLENMEPALPIRVPKVLHAVIVGKANTWKANTWTRQLQFRRVHARTARKVNLVNPQAM